MHTHTHTLSFSLSIDESEYEEKEILQDESFAWTKELIRAFISAAYVERSRKKEWLVSILPDHSINHMRRLFDNRKNLRC